MEQEGWVGSLRVGAVYLCGVVAGTLGTSLSDPSTYIAGASGGVYALIAAHLATLALNWHEDSAVRIRKVIHKPLTRVIRLVFIITLTLHDIGLAIYVRFFSETPNQVCFCTFLSVDRLCFTTENLSINRLGSWVTCAGLSEVYW